MSQANSTTAIFYAFSANLVIAIAKTAVALYTGSGSLIAEAIHSFADCGNQVLLYIGMQRATKAATQKHPMGFGRESYIWSMMVALILFSVGGMFSIYEGWQRYHEPQPVENATVALLILGIAVVMEAFSLKGAISAMKTEQGNRSFWQWFKETHSSELMVITGEDIAALAGLVIALIMLGLTLVTGNTAFDALGSMLVGLLLVVVAAAIGKEVHSLLIGETAADVRNNVQKYLEQQPSVVKILNLWVINHGDGVMVTIKAELKPDLLVSEATKMINHMEKQIKLDNPRVKWIFFEIDDVD